MKKSIKLNAIFNMIRQSCSILIPLITIPYVSRTIGVSEYGRYNFSTSIVSYFTLIAALGINSYAVREGARVRANRSEFEKFTSEVFSINVLSTIVAYIGLFCLLIYGTQLNEYRDLILIQSTSILLITLGVDWVNTVYEDYLYITIRYIILQIVALILILTFVKSPTDCVIYTIICVFASAGGNILNFFYIRKYVKIRLTIKVNLRRHMKPIMYLFFNSLAVTIYVSSDTTILGLYKGDVDVGIYSIATKIYTVVKQVLNSMIIVALPQLSEYVAQNNLDNYRKTARKILECLIMFVMPSVVGLIFLRKEIILLIAGVEYLEAFRPLTLLSIALGVTVIAAFYAVNVLMPYKKENICLKASVISAVINITLNFLIIPAFSYTGAAFTSLIAEIIAFVIYYRESKKIICIRPSKNIIISSIIGSLEIAIVCFVIKRIIREGVLRIMISIILSVLIYSLVQVSLRNYLVMEFVDNMKRRLIK